MKSLFELNEVLREYYSEKINKELENQYKKFGNQQHSLERWFTILSEEIGEIAKAINENDYKNLHYEIIQSITVLIQLDNRMRYGFHKLHRKEEK